jgi:hypothetical protein
MMVKQDSFRQEESEPVAGTPMGVQILSFLCGLVVAILGFKSVHQDFLVIRKLTHLDSFVEVPGKLLQVKVRVDSTGSAEDFYPDVLYEYFVQGASIWGWRLSYEEKPASKSYWENRLSGYSVGTAVRVFYNPALPKDSILEKRHENLFRNWMKMLLGIGFLLVGLVLALLPMTTWLRKIFSPKSS